MTQHNPDQLAESRLPNIFMAISFLRSCIASGEQLSAEDNRQIDVTVAQHADLEARLREAEGKVRRYEAVLKTAYVVLDRMSDDGTKLFDDVHTVKNQICKLFEALQGGKEKG